MEKELINGVKDMGLISDINVTPFIDIMLVLLIIFMVTAPLMLGGVQVNLPKARGNFLPRPNNPTLISLNVERKIFIDKEEIPKADRQVYFQRLAEKSETGEIFVRGDSAVQYSEITELMAELGQAGFARIILVTDIRPTSTPEPDPGTAAAPTLDAIDNANEANLEPK
ncbi:MAG: hypothetical protein AMR96_00915 [Candidatus Adiutrix intracellularis]|nr:MAG: hypothetical protein AMR96_00915 [Candidatus Adiutrix intracellularis]